MHEQLSTPEANYTIYTCNNDFRYCSFYILCASIMVLLLKMCLKHIRRHSYQLKNIFFMTHLLLTSICLKLYKKSTFQVNYCSKYDKSNLFDQVACKKSFKVENSLYDIVFDSNFNGKLNQKIEIE